MRTFKILQAILVLTTGFVKAEAGVQIPLVAAEDERDKIYYQFERPIRRVAIIGAGVRFDHSSSS